MIQQAEPESRRASPTDPWREAAETVLERGPPLAGAVVGPASADVVAAAAAVVAVAAEGRLA